MSAQLDPSTDTVVVGRIGRPHGVRGLATVEVRTDDPDVRFAPGEVLHTDPPARGPLTIVGRKWHSGTLLLQLAAPSGEVYETREAVEELRNTLLVVRRTDGGEALIPFVSAIVPTVDLAGGFLVVDPPEGLLEL